MGSKKMEGITWKTYKAGEKYEPFLERKDKEKQFDEMLDQWSERFLHGAGIISMVKEGVFINESLNHLKQFLLKRSGGIESLLQTRTATGDFEFLTDPKSLVPGTSKLV